MSFGGLSCLGLVKLYGRAQKKLQQCGLVLIFLTNLKKKSKKNYRKLAIKIRKKKKLTI